MPSGSKKGETKETMTMVWQSLKGLLAYIYEALCSGVLSIYKYAPTSEKSLHSAKICEHKNASEAESYYGSDESQYYSYWYCEDCGEEILDDYGIDI